MQTASGTKASVITALSAQSDSVAAVRRCRADDVPQLMTLFKDAYRFNPRLQERDYVDWQFADRSEDGRYNLLVVEQDSEITGFLGYVPVEICHEGCVVKGCWPQKWMSPRGGYAGITMMSELYDEYDNLLFAGLTDETIRIFGVLGVPTLTKMPRWIGILEPAAVCRVFGVSAQDDIAMLKTSRSQLADPDIKSGCRPCERFDEDDDFRLDRWPGVTSYTRRSGRFLNWRYFDIPRHDYQALRDDDGGFAVYRIESISHHREAVVRILEWGFAGAAAECAMAMIVGDAISKGAILMDFFCTATEVGLELERLGFLSDDRIDSMIPHLFRPIHYSEGIAAAVDMPPHRTERELDFSRWYITKGDSDIDRIKL